MRKSTLILSLIIFMLIGCSPIKYSFDVKDDYPFDEIKTFNFSNDIKKIKTINPDNIELTKKIIKKELELKGFSISDQPDIWVNFFGYSFVSINEHETNIRNDGMVQSGSSYMIRPSENSDILDGTVYIDILDSGSDKSIWQGKAESEISGNSEQNVKIIEDAIRGMLTNFPPAEKQ